MKEKILIMFLAAFFALSASGCDNGSKDVSGPDSSEAHNEVWPEATMWVASAIKIDASVYFYKGSIHPHIIYDTIRDDGGFGTYLIENHSALEGMEYVIEFETRGPRNVFCLQKNTDPVTIGCDGEYTKLSDWGFETWDDVLSYYKLDALN